MQFCNNDFSSNTRIPWDFYNHMSILQGFNLNTFHLRGFWSNHKDITGIVDWIYSFRNSPYLKKILVLKYSLNINIVTLIWGEYKVYKPSYFLIAEFFSLRVHIFIYILSSLLVMEYIFKNFRHEISWWAIRSVRHGYAIPAGYMDTDTTDTDTDDHICIRRHTRIHIHEIHTRHGGYGSSSLLYYVEYTVKD